MLVMIDPQTSRHKGIARHCQKSNERPNEAAGLLNDVTWTEIAGIQRFATGKSFVLAVVKTDAILAKPPAQVNFFVINQGREVE